LSVGFVEIGTQLFQKCNVYAHGMEVRMYIHLIKNNTQLYII